jgi:hypothetical protein
MSATSIRGLSARTIAWGSVAALAGMAAVAQQNALNAQRKHPLGATSSGCAVFDCTKSIPVARLPQWYCFMAMA